MSDIFAANNSRPCKMCAEGRHLECIVSVCECIANHPDDSSILRGFKILRRATNPEREAWVKGGWS